MSVLGIDLAAGARKTYACTMDVQGSALRARLFAGCDDKRLIELAEGCTKVAIDAPFGWPGPFIDALVAHRGFEAWPAPDDDRPEVFRAGLSFRATDRVVMHTRRPLSVSTDKLGVTAMRCAHLLQRWASSGAVVDRAGAGRFVEVYPAGALVRWGFAASGYKGSDKAPLEGLLDQLQGRLPQLELCAGDRELCRSVDDAFDALIAALVARAAALALTDGPPPARLDAAREEGWIHLPVRGSLELLACQRGELASRPAAAFAERLAASGVVVSATGYADRLDEVLLVGFSDQIEAAIRADLAGKGGSELVGRGAEPPRFHAAHSSACLAANVFGPWLVATRPIPFDGQDFCGETHLEVCCPTGLSGTPPTLDCLVDGPNVLAVESKCTETFAAHEASFSPAYRALVASVADPSWADEYKRLVEDPRRYRFLDAAQLVKHYLGLCVRFDGRPITLAYLYWEPVNASDTATCRIHAAELAEFSARVTDRRVRFVGRSYGALWRDWEDLDEPWLREHVAALRGRYDVSV